MYWEYKVVQVKSKIKGFVNPKNDFKDFEIMLNELGRSGWELVQSQLPSSQTWGKQDCTAVFKRPK